MVWQVDDNVYGYMDYVNHVQVKSYIQVEAKVKITGNGMNGVIGYQMKKVKVVGVRWLWRNVLIRL